MFCSTPCAQAPKPPPANVEDDEEPRRLVSSEIEFGVPGREATAEDADVA